MNLVTKYAQAVHRELWHTQAQRWRSTPLTDVGKARGYVAYVFYFLKDTIRSLRTHANVFYFSVRKQK